MKNTLAYNIIKDGKMIQELMIFDRASNKKTVQPIKNGRIPIVYDSKIEKYRYAYKKCKDDIHKIFKTYATMFYILGIENLQKKIESSRTYNNLFIKNAIPQIYNYFEEKYGLTKVEVNMSCFYYLFYLLNCNWFLDIDEEDDTIIALDFATDEDSGVYELIYASTWVGTDKSKWL